MLRRRQFVSTMAGVLGALPLLSACQSPAPAPAPSSGGGPTGAGQGTALGLGGSLDSIATARGLTPDDVAAALMTYTPSGKFDEYYMFASGGHSGQILVIGLPSMRQLKTIAVFTPEPWQGYGYGSKETQDILAGGGIDGRVLTAGDTHHPALSETNGDYDGQWLFINDKTSGRIAVIDLRDFETKQILKNPLLMGDHGSTMVTPNTEYVVEGAQYATPLGWSYAPLGQYQAEYRGAITFWKFDRELGRIDPAQSFSMELPPYWQDLADAGKLVSNGWIFVNSLNTEMSTGGIEDGKPPFEAGTSQHDMDYLHVINWQKAEATFKAGRVQPMKGHPVIKLQTAIDDGLLYLVPEPKSPHGVDVTPNGDYMVVAGKLDPHVTVYSFDKLQKAIVAGATEHDMYGIPILKFEQVMETQVELGLGPLHTQYDDQGYAYTSLFLDSAVARWSLGPPYRQDGWKLEAKLPVHYNVGHLVSVQGDTAHPSGKFLVAMNKWALDRFLPVGPLHPQNLQLVDISQGGDQMKLLYDLPIGNAEPHYAQIIPADRLKPWALYPDTGWDSATQSKGADAPVLGQERIVRTGNRVDVWMTVVRSHFNPEHVEVSRGDHVVWRISNPERAQDATHGFALAGHDVSLSLEPGKSATIEFDADRSGVYPFYCTEFCSALHLEIAGYFLVKP
jgi:nitrous-oxide reductase